MKTKSLIDIFSFFLLYILVFCNLSCKEESHNTENDLNKLYNELINRHDVDDELRYKFKSNNITNKNYSILIKEDTPISSSDGDLLYFQVKDTLYVTNLNLVIIERHKLNINGEIIRIINRQDDLLYLDLSSGICNYKYNLRSKINIPLQNVKYQSDKGTFIDLCFFKDDFITTTPIIFANLKNDIIIGRKFDSTGYIKEHFILPSKYVDKYWQNIIDWPFCKIYNGKVFFSFVYSPSIFIYDLKSNFIDKKRYIIDENNWKIPIFENDPNLIENYIISKQGLVINSDFIYHIVNVKFSNRPLLIKYNLEFDIINIKLLNININKKGYRIYFVRNNFIVHSDYLYFFDKF